jgi:hypothetical protein
MIKVARKPSADPVQEKLRQSKDQWNKEVSLFIEALKNFKKMMNGYPSKIFKQKSRITDPIPSDPVSIVGALAGDFQEISQKANAIVSQQLEYSKTRRKKQVSPPAGPTPVAPPAPPTTDLSKQLSAPLIASFEDKYELVTEGSSKISRFFTRLFNPAAGFGDAANLRRARMAMLNACAEAYKNLGKFQVQVVKSSKESIHISNQKLNEVWHHWTLVSRAYVIFKSSKSVSTPDKGGTIQSDIAAQDLKEESAIENLGVPVKEPATPATPPAPPVTPPPEESKEKVASLQIEKVAQDFLNKWVGKTVHQLSLFDKTSPHRLSIYRIAEELRQEINAIMDLLEKGLDEAQLDPLIKSVNTKMVSLRVMMRSLNLSSEK